MSFIPPHPPIDWDQIDSVFLDMDGTLLDLHFDNHFWLEHVPLRYAESRDLPLEQAKRELLQRYQDVEGTLRWYCVDHWSCELRLDIALLKQEVDHLIAVHPYVTEFLECLSARGKRRVLVTNAHQKSIELKMEKTRLAGHFDHIICSHDLGVAKETEDFWERVQVVEPFDPDRTLFVDDSVRVLAAAKAYGFRWLLAILKPDSNKPVQTAQEFPAVEHFAELLPELATNTSRKHV